MIIDHDYLKINPLLIEYCAKRGSNIVLLQPRRGIKLFFNALHYWMPVEDRVFSGDQVRHDGVKNIAVRDPIPMSIQRRINAASNYRP